MAQSSTECDPVWLDAEDPLFMLYTRSFLLLSVFCIFLVHYSKYYIVYA